MPTGDAYSSWHLVPSLCDLHTFYMLRPILFPNLSLYFLTMLFQYPSVLSRFCLKMSPQIRGKDGQLCWRISPKYLGRGCFFFISGFLEIRWAVAEKKSKISQSIRIQCGRLCWRVATKTQTCRGPCSWKLIEIRSAVSEKTTIKKNDTGRRRRAGELIWYKLNRVLELNAYMYMQSIWI